MIKTKDVRQTVTFSVSPHVLYEAIMDSKKHAKFSGELARISKKIGGISRAYGSYIYSINLDLVKDKRIVQAWRGAGWPRGHFSIVSYKFKPTKKGTALSFTHIDIPAKEAKHIDSGWKTHYWQPIKKMLKDKS